MKSIHQFLKDECGIEMPLTGTINGEWFAKNRLPMIVECECCGSTMALPSAFVDDNGYTYCEQCAN